MIEVGKYNRKNTNADFDSNLVVERVVLVVVERVVSADFNSDHDHDDHDNDDKDDYSCNSVSFKVRTSRFFMELDINNI